jgi:hypothetical protein
MTELLSYGLNSLHEAAAIIEDALFAGKAESQIVQQLRIDGLDVREREARTQSVKELWKAVDQHRIDALVVCGTRAQPLHLRPAQTKAVPFLRNPSVGSFAYLRPSHSLFRELMDWAGHDMSRLRIVFKTEQVLRLAKRLVRMRRSKTVRTPTRRGRPRRSLHLDQVLRELIKAEAWSPTQSMKRLTHLANRKLPAAERVSDSTVARALDQLHSETQDRRFARFRRSPSKRA